MSKAVINKSYLLKLHNEGLSVPSMVERIKEELGIQISVNNLRKGFKNFGISLKKKPKEKDVIFVDDMATEGNFQAPVEEQPVAFNEVNENGHSWQNF